MEYTMDGLAKEFKEQADRYDKWYNNWEKQFPETAQEYTKFNLPYALYLMASEISRLQDGPDGE